MSTVKTFNATQSALVNSLNVNWNDHSGGTENVDLPKAMLVGFTDDLTGEDRFRAIESGSFAAFLYGAYGAGLRVYELQGPFDENTVAYSRLPQTGLSSLGDLIPDGAYGANYYHSISVGSSERMPLAFLQYGAYLMPYANGGASVDTSRGSHPPTLQLTLGEVCGLDSIQIRTMKQAYWMGPYQFYKGLPMHVYWLAQCTAATVQEPWQTSAELRWRTAEGAAEHTIPISGSTSGVDLPAATFGGINAYDPAQMTTPRWFLSVSGSTYTVTSLGSSASLRTIVLPCEGGTEYHIKSGIPGTLRAASFGSNVALGSTSTHGIEVTSSSDPNETTLTTGADDTRLVIQFFIESDVSAYGATLDKALTDVVVETAPRSSIQLQVSITADSGVTTTSDWTTIYSAGMGFSVNCSPTGGYVGKAAANTFQWAPILASGASGTLEQTSAVFRWRPTGGQATETALTTEQSVTLPANTFTTDAVEWQVETVVNGTRMVSDWMELSTVEALATAVPLSPIGTLVDGSAPALFRWAHYITTGTAPTGADLQISADGGNTWTQLAHVSGSDTFYEAAAGALSAGDLWWRVRSYNTDDAAGDWSPAAPITVVAAPPAPTVTADATPRPLISWQSEGQQGYEIRIDGEAVHRDWGTASSWQMTEILADGTHLIEVRVQNSYGLWSEYGSTAVTTANVPGGEISLSLTGRESVALSWTAAGYESFRVLRDGKLLTVTQDFGCVDDRAGAGAHVYQIVGLLSGGYFGLSNEIVTEVSIPCPMLLDVARGVWLRLTHFLSGQRQISDGWKPDVNLVHYSGRGYPTAEIGAARSRTVTLRPAFTPEMRSDAEALSALCGKRLFYKDPRGAAFPAVITQLTCETQKQRFVFTLTLEEIDDGGGGGA